MMILITSLMRYDWHWLLKDGPISPFSFYVDALNAMMMKHYYSIVPNYWVVKWEIGFNVYVSCRSLCSTPFCGSKIFPIQFCAVFFYNIFIFDAYLNHHRLYPHWWLCVCVCVVASKFVVLSFGTPKRVAGYLKVLQLLYSYYTILGIGEPTHTHFIVRCIRVKG